MATRRDAREWAVQLLFGLDMNPRDLGEVFGAFWHGRDADRKARRYAERIVQGVVAGKDECDKIIRECAENWDVWRMGVVERNVLRMAVYEMLYCPAVPPVVVINEAVDLAKYYSHSESGRFVNGILDRLRRDLEKSTPTHDCENGEKAGAKGGG